MVAMSIRTSRWPAGVPCWVDLSVPDVPAAQAFYGSVLGWSFDEDDAERYGGYTIALVGGNGAAGIGPQPQEGQATWTLYFASDDADATAAAVEKQGGTVLYPPDSVGPLGRMFIGLDPTGAPFGVWQAGQYIGAGVVNEPGALVWEDLRSPDPDTARTFYTDVFGFRTERLEMAGPDYTTFALPGEAAPLGGIGGMMGADDAPAHWLVYFGVADTPAAVAAAEHGGGSVLIPVMDSPFGRLAVLTDPTGATFSVIETDGSQPDRAG
jgi:predicted enzyme related to lactoylglutathione lyase